MAVLKFMVSGVGGGIGGHGGALFRTICSAVLFANPLPDGNGILDVGSQDDVDRDEDVDAESLLQEDSRLDSVSVEPALPIDMVLPICIPIAFMGFTSPTNIQIILLK